MAKQPTLESRMKGAIFGLAVCDALGGPVEFKSRGSFQRVTTMLPNDNFGLPRGYSTDDTSMALCLAHSLLDCSGKSDTMDQVKKYVAWFRHGYMSSTGDCFDIGLSTRRALTTWETLLDTKRSRDTSGRDEAQQAHLNIIGQRFTKEEYCGNGSLMRVLPTALITSNESDALALARESSLPTHPHPRCVTACIVYVHIVQYALDGASKEELATSLGNFINKFPSDLVQIPKDAVLAERIGRYRCLRDWEETPCKSIRSTGYVVDTLEASLWAFFTTHNFRDAAIRAVNLGDDADTIGAVCGGLAGVSLRFSRDSRRLAAGPKQKGNSSMKWLKDSSVIK